MRDIPIIFSAPMVRALLDGRKTMTRRLATSIIDGATRQAIRSSPWQRAAPGDRLWVREAFTEPNDQVVIYRANWREDALARGLQNIPDTDAGLRWHPSIHMPRWASRLTLTVTSVKIERLQGISEDDARAEGSLYVPGHGDITPYELWADPGYSNFLNCRQGFEMLWNALHGDGAWETNPEVVAISFHVERRNIDAAA